MSGSGNREREIQKARTNRLRQWPKVARAWLTASSPEQTRARNILGVVATVLAILAFVLTYVIEPGRVDSSVGGGTEREEGDEPATAPEALDNVQVVDVPPLDGMTPDEAEGALGDAGLRLGNVVEVDGQTGPPGTVVGQAPEAGSTSDAGADVDVEVTGPTLAVVPDLDGLSEDEAAGRLSDAGFDMQITTEPADMPAGQVLSQQPRAEQDAPEGSSVNVTLSRGPAPVRLASSDIEPIAEQKCLRGTNTGYPWTIGTVSIGQQQFGNAWMCAMFEDANGWLDFEIGGRGFTEFSAHVGLSDLSTSIGERARFTIYGDGIELASVDVDSQNAEELTADVSDVSRLRIEVLKLVHAEERWTVTSSIGAIAEPTLQ
jgi:hypothetical protein